MSATDNITAEKTARQTEAFIDRMLESTAGAFNIFTMYMGDRLGFYRALVEGGPSTSGELASRTGTNERYAREWLEQQTIAGTLTVEDAQTAPEARRFSLPPAHAEVLVESDSLNYLAPLARMVVAAGRPMQSILKAYRNGGGVPYLEYGADLREGQADMNRAMFLKQLGTEYFPSIPDIHTRLQSDPPARVADIGCGAGWSSIGIANAYPKVRVDGYDLDAVDAAIRAAQAESAMPSMIVAHTNIAKFSPNKQDSSSSHGAPLGEDEIDKTKEIIGWPLEPKVHIPDEPWLAAIV